MAKFEGKFLKVWKKEEQNGFIKLNLGESKKKYKEDGYDSWTWFGCTLLGDAKSVQVNEGDKVHASGIIEQRKYNEKWYNDIKIFQLEIVESEKKDDFMSLDDDMVNGFQAIEDDNDIPF